MFQRGWHRVATPRIASWTIALVGLAGVMVALLLPNAYTRVLPAFVLLGAAAGAVGYRNGFSLNRGRVPWLTHDGRRLRIGVLALYIATLCAITVSYVLAGFYRPFAVQALLVVLYGLVAIVLLVGEAKRSGLVLLLVTAVYHRGLIYYASAIQLGNDALFHTRTAAEIVASGSLAPLAASKYWYAPLFHLAVSGTSMGLGIPVRDAAFLAATIPAVVVPPVVVFAFLRRNWGGTVAAFGAFLVVVADHSILTAVHVTPTSLGLALFALVLYYGERYLRDADTIDLGAFGLAVVGLMLTHQLSMFVAVVGLGSYVGATTVWRWRIGIRELELMTLLGGSFLLQSVFTRYEGPAGEGASFMATVGEWMVASFTRVLSGGGRTAGYPPEAADVAVSGADALTPVQVLGLGGLFGLAVLGTVVWVGRSDDEPLRQAVSLGAVAAVTSGLVFAPPAVGINVFIPGRWFPFIYVVLAALAAPSIGMLVTKARGVSGGRVVVPLIVILALVVPYAGLMTMNAYGAPDNPVFDEAPAASRFTTTPVEAAGYEFVADRAGETRVVGDFGSWRVIERYYGHPATVYETTYGEPGTVFDGDQLLVYREYSRTNHASYFLVVDGRGIRVFGPLPGPEPTDSAVYSNGDVRVYRHPGGAG